MGRGVTISLCMIVKNEEGVLARCLESVRGIADEIIIVDTGSTDKTKEIASRYTPRIYDFAWVDDFAKARNFAFSKASLEYVLWLDADDIILEPDRRKFIALKKSLDHKVDSVSMVYVLSRDSEGRPTFALRRNRLVKRARAFKWIGAVHEYLEVSGDIVLEDIAITHSSLHHDSDRNLRIYEGRLAAGEEFTPRDLYYYANELKDHSRFEDAALYYAKFLDTGRGWVEDNIAACQKLYECLMQQTRKEEAYMSLLRSFTYDLPRAFTCCRIADMFFEQRSYDKAAFWYEMATTRKPAREQWGPSSDAFWTWVPHLQLCVCYDKLGDRKLAEKHNEIAAQYLPADDRRIEYNRKYFAEQ